MERIEKWLKTFWWARGAVTVITLITLIAPLLNLEMHNFLKILHAFIVGWNIVTNSVGEKLSYLLQISIRPTLINTILLCVSAIWPFCYFLIKRIMLLHKQAVFKNFFRLSIPVGLLLSSFSGIYVAYKAENLLDAHISRELYLIRYFSSRIPSENVKKDFENCLIYQAKPTSCLTQYVEKTNITEGKKKMFVDYANMEASNKIFSAFNLGDSILFYLFLFLSTICFIATCFLSREYRRGAVHLFVFLFTIEVLYFLPKVGTWLEEFADLILLSSS